MEILILIVIGMFIANAVLPQLNAQEPKPGAEKHCPPHQWKYLNENTPECHIKCLRCGMIPGRSLIDPNSKPTL